MIHVKEVSTYSGSDYEYLINDTIHTQANRGWRFIDIKHSVTAYGPSANSNLNLFSAFLIFDDSPTVDVPTSLSQY